MVKQVYSVTEANDGQARLDHYNKWLINPKREMGTVYPGYPLDKKSKVKAKTPTVKGKPRMSVDKVVDNGTVVMDTKKAPRTGSKLSQALEIVKSTGKDDKESCLQALVSALTITRGNASIYYAKSRDLLG